MKNILIIMLAAIAMVAGVEAKPEMCPEKHVRPVEMKVEGKKKEMPKFHAKRHGHKHHVRPHGKRCHKHSVRPMLKHAKPQMKHQFKKQMPKMGHRPTRKPMESCAIVRPVRKHVMRKPEMNAPIVRPVRKVTKKQLRVKQPRIAPKH